MKVIYWKVKGVERRFQEWLPMLLGGNRQQQGTGKSYRSFCGVELSRVIFRVRIGGISSPEFEGAQDLVGFPIQGLLAFVLTLHLN